MKSPGARAAQHRGATISLVPTEDGWLSHVDAPRCIEDPTAVIRIVRKDRGGLLMAEPGLRRLCWSMMCAPTSNVGVAIRRRSIAAARLHATWLLKGLFRVGSSFGTVQSRTGGLLCAGYDAPNFRDMGLVRDMGGIGAHNEASQLRLH